MDFNDDEHLNFLIENAPIGIAILDAATFTVEMLNDKFIEIAGKPKEAILNKWYWESFAEVRSNYEAALVDVVKTGKSYFADEVELMLIRHGKEKRIFVTFVYAPVKNAAGHITKLAVWVLENTREIRSEQKIISQNTQLAATNKELTSVNEKLTQSQRRLGKLHQQLEEEAAQRARNAEYAKFRLEAMVMNTPIAMSILSGEDLVVEIANHPMLAVWRRTLDQVTGRSLLEIFPELNGQPNPARMREVLHSGKRFSLPETEVVLGTVDGILKKHYARFSYDPIFEPDGNVGSILVTVIDITKEVTTRMNLEESRAALQQNTEKLAAANEELAAINEELTVTQTALWQINENLSESESRFRELVKQAPVAIFVVKGRDMVFETVNDLMFRILGKDNEIIGSTYADAVPELIGQPFFQLLDEVYISGETFYGNEVKGSLNIDGKLTEGYFNFIYQAIKNDTGDVTGVMCVAINVLEQVIARKELEQAYEQLRLSKDAAQLGFFDMDLIEGKLEWDARCRELFGISHSDTITYEKDFVNGLHPEDKERILAIINNVFIRSVSNGDYDVEYRTVGAEDKQLRWIRAKGQVYFNQDDKPIRFIGSVLDITEQKQDEIRKNDFIGMVSHELKTPLTSLTAIIQMSNLKLKKSEDAFLAGAMEKANVQVKRMTTMINGFLNVSRLESGKISIDKQRFDMAELVKESEAETIPMYSSHRVIFAPVEPTIVIADRNKIGQVINNFISNAVKYSKSGSNIYVDCKTGKGSAIVSVKDEGIGIDKKELSRLFERYYRVEETKHVSGFGIGLYLCFEIIERHRGKIWVESEPGKGSTFFFSIPTQK